LEGEWVGSELRSRHTALALVAVALPAAVPDERRLAFFSRRCIRVCRVEREGGGKRRRPDDGPDHSRTRLDPHGPHDPPVPHLLFPCPHRGCVHTSTNAGSPAFTTSTARLRVGPSSAGSLIGPALQTPIDFAIDA